MDNQALDQENIVPKVAQAVIAILVVAVIVVAGFYFLQRTDPYVQDVLALPGNPAQGQAIFQMNCAGCHGVQAHGRVGPSLLDLSSRKTKSQIIYQVISGQTPPMPQFQPSSQEMADLLSYLETL